MGTNVDTSRNIGSKLGSHVKFHWIIIISWERTYILIITLC